MPLIELLESLGGVMKKLHMREKQGRDQLRKQVGELARTSDRFRTRALELGGEVANKQSRLSDAEAEWAARNKEVHRLHREAAVLRRENECLSEQNNRLRMRHRQMQQVADDMQGLSPMVIIKQRAAPTRITWHIPDVTDVIGKYPKAMCVYSPEFTSPESGVHSVEFQFYPNGSSDAPRHQCSLGLRCPRGTHVTMQLFVGIQRSDAAEVFFTKETCSYMQHFRLLHDEVLDDESLKVGVEILRNHGHPKYVVH